MYEMCYVEISFLFLTAFNVFQKISFLRFTSPPLPLYGCKAHEHWAQAEGGVLLTTPSTPPSTTPCIFS